MATTDDTLQQLAAELNRQEGAQSSLPDPLSSGKPEEKAMVLRFHPPARPRSEVISKLACSRYSVHRDTRIDDLASDLHSWPEIAAVGVIDDRERVQGIVVRKELFDILGRPYGRDLFKKRPVTEIMAMVDCFADQAGILTVAEALQSRSRDADTLYYLLQNEREEFTGIFSTKSILVYLSDITQKDLQMARELQKSIVKEEIHLREGGLEIAGASRMAKEVGGDFTMALKVAPGRIVAAVCDISGKGVAASLLSAVLGGIASAYDFRNGLKRFVRTINQYVARTFNQERYITCIMLEMNCATGEILLADMGHSYLYVIGQGRALKMKTDASNMPLGIVADAGPVLNTYRLKDREILCICTDGLIEQRNAAGEEYSEKRLMEAIRGSWQATLVEIRQVVLDDIAAFKGSQAQHDDLTFLMARQAP